MVPVDGTRFSLISVPIIWEYARERDTGRWALSYDTFYTLLAFDAHHLLGVHPYQCDLGKRLPAGLSPEGLPTRYPEDPDEVPGPDVAWALKVPAGEMRQPVLWRQADAEYVARQLHEACPDAWPITNQAALQAALPERLHDWAELVAPLLNRDVPRDLLVGCRAYIEARYGGLIPARQHLEATPGR
jgi:hypothetical protein